MMRGLLTLATLSSVIVFPWSVSVLLSLIAVVVEPFVPLAAGLFADTLYYTPQAATLPLFAICGALTTAGAFFVRSRLKTSTIS